MKLSTKAYRKTGKNLQNYDFDTIFIPPVNRYAGWSL